VPRSRLPIRTGDFGCKLFTFSKTAENLYGWENGLAFVEGPVAHEQISAIAIKPALDRRHAGSRGSSCGGGSRAMA